jgi:crotonobetainyl-CoA:carnitine CoA-transferase CaiB-like acyl-CoA transferase
VVTDPQARAIGAWIRIEGTEVEGRPVESVDSPVRFGGISRDAVSAPPRSGEHTAAVLAELGYDEAAIAELTEDHEHR